MDDVDAGVNTGQAADIGPESGFFEGPVAETQAAAPVAESAEPSPPDEAGTPEPNPESEIADETDAEPSGPDEPAVAESEDFTPQIAILHLERGGVFVEGRIDVQDGEGVRELIKSLEAKILAVRAGETQPASAPSVIDPTLLREERAKLAGHEIDPDGKRCNRCGNAAWWCWEGNPCVPKPAPAPTTAED